MRADTGADKGADSALRTAVSGRVLLPGDAGFAAAARPWNLAVEQPVAAVVEATDADDVAAVVRYARRTGRAVAAQTTGHGAAPGTDGAILLRTRRLDAVEVRPELRLARVGAGVTWDRVLAAAAPYRLTGLAGSSPVVGVAGYTLSGGLSWYGRAHGWAADAVTAFEVVDADGGRARVTAETDPELFWALRGGGGVGVVTRLRFDLREVPSVYGGFLMLPATPETLHGVVAAGLEAPDELTMIVMTMRAPPLPFLPPEAHGQPVVAVRGAYLGGEEAGKAAFAPLRALAQPLLDAVQPMPYAAMIDEPPGPPMKVRFTSAFRDGWDLATAERVMGLVTSAGPGMKGVQLRPLGGAIDRAPDAATAYPHRRRRLFVGALASPVSDEALPEALGWLGQVRATLGEGPAAFFSFLDAGGAGTRDAFPGAVWERLQEVRRAYDPHGVFGAPFATQDV